MFSLRAKIAFLAISLGYRMLPPNLRTRAFVYNAMLAGYIKTSEGERSE